MKISGYCKFQSLIIGLFLFLAIAIWLSAPEIPRWEYRFENGSQPFVCSPDGLELALLNERSTISEASSIEFIDTQTGNRRTWTGVPNALWLEAEFSPDSASLAVRSSWDYREVKFIFIDPKLVRVSLASQTED